MNLSCFLLGLLAGVFIGAFFAARYYGNLYKHLVSLIPGVTFENRLLVQTVLALFPTDFREVQVYVKKRRFRVFQEEGDVKYLEVPA